MDFALSSQSHTARSSLMPKLDFPKFDGENPCLWKDRCEQYFEVYAISEVLKPRFAALNFVGTAAVWLQTVELRGRFQSWPALSDAICKYFDRDQYQLHMKRLDHLKQSGSVAAYFESFQELPHHILLYNNPYDDVYFVTRFMGGLKEEIHSPIVLHRPKNLEEAYSLALIQEEELAGQKLKGSRWDQKYAKSVTSSNKFRGNPKKDDFRPMDSKPLEDKWNTVKAYRKANGLCFTCGEK